MAKLFVPACGDRITIAQPWQFKLYLEHRNMVFAKEHNLVPNTGTHNWWGITHPGTNNYVTVDHVIDPGTILECDRVYIRATSKSADTVEDSYDSITWKIVVNGKAAKKGRFWVKLSDCYNLEFDPGSISRYQDRK
jgi:hypothetical protein